MSSSTEILVEKVSAPEAGLHRDIDSERYHAWNGASNSRLLKICGDGTPAQVYDEIINPPEATDAMIVGDAAHLIILQGDNAFSRKYIVAGECVAIKEKGGKCTHSGVCMIANEWFCGVHARSSRHKEPLTVVSERLRSDGFVLEKISNNRSLYLTHPDGRRVRVADHAPSFNGLTRMMRDGRESIRVDLPPYGKDDPRRILSPKDYDTCRIMRDAVMGHRGARAIIDARTDTELSGVWVCRDTGVKCKMRIDLTVESLSLIPDLKTTTDASRDAFKKTIEERGYALQAAMYLDGMAQNGRTFDSFCNIVVEKNPPKSNPSAGVAIYRIADHTIAAAHEAVIKRKLIWKKCEETGVWPGYSEDVQEISLSDYALAKMEQV